MIGVLLPLSSHRVSLSPYTPRPHSQTHTTFLNFTYLPRSWAGLNSNPSSSSTQLHVLCAFRSFLNHRKMREIRDRRDRTSWTYPVPHNVTQPNTTNTDQQLSYPDSDHCSASNSLSLTTSCHPPLSSTGSPHSHPNPSPSALLPSLPSVYNPQYQHNRLFIPATGSQRASSGTQADQLAAQQYPTPDHLHRQLAPLVSSFLFAFSGAALGDILLCI